MEIKNAETKTSSLEFERFVFISNDYRELIKDRRYENLVFRLISKSTVVFDRLTFTKIETQSNGECDFKDNNNTKYDAKLLIDSKQGALIGEKKNDILLWIKDTIEEINEFPQRLQVTQDYSFIPNTRLYKIMKERITTVKEDENVIFFSPFPLVADSQQNYLNSFCTDYLDAVYKCLTEEGLIGNRRVYYIYHSQEQDVYVLRDDHSAREYISMPELDSLMTISDPIIS